MKLTQNSPDELFEVELRIAQRADELVRLHGTDPVHALEHWRQAEREVWTQTLDRAFDPSPRVHAPSRN